MKIKTNLTSIRITLVISLIILFNLFSCRSVKKEWVKENFTEKSELQEIKENLTYSNELVKEDIRKSILSEFNKSLIEINSKLNETLEENTIAKIDIEAEFGKIKEATIGNTKVTSNGAKISVETITSKYLQKDYESYKQENKETIEMLLNETLLLESNLEIVAKENNSLKTELKQIKDTQSKNVTIKQFSLGILLLILGFVIYKFWDKIKALLPFKI